MSGPPMTGAGTLVERHRWLVFVLPFAVYMLAGALEPSRDSPGGTMLGLAIPYSAYPLVYTVKIVLTLAAMAFVLPGYRQFRQRPGFLAVVVGAVGVVAWVGLCAISDYTRLTTVLNGAMAEIHLYAPRPAFNPFDAHVSPLAVSPALNWSFFGIRFFGLVVVVPVIEEFFLRGFLMRVVMEADWWKVPFGAVNRRRSASGPSVAAAYASAGRISRRNRLVRHGHLAHGPHAQSVGLRSRPCGHQSAAGRLCGCLGQVGLVVILPQSLHLEYGDTEYPRSRGHQPQPAGMGTSSFPRLLIRRRRL